MWYLRKYNIFQRFSLKLHVLDIFFKNAAIYNSRSKWVMFMI